MEDKQAKRLSVLHSINKLREKYPNKVKEIQRNFYEYIVNEGETKEKVADLKTTTIAVFIKVST